MTAMAHSVQETIAARGRTRGRLLQICDWCAVALAVSLPWSTSATGILAGLWVIAVIPTLDAMTLRRELSTFAGGLPVLFWALGVVGMLWADVSLAERLDGLGSFHKLLVIPLLLIHFRRSERGQWVMMGFLLSCGVLLVTSWGLYLFPDFQGGQRATPGVPVKDYISQSAMFSVGLAIAIDLALSAWRMARFDVVFVHVMLALAFLANIFVIATSRTALVVLPILLLLFGLKRFDWKRALAFLAVLISLAAAAWPVSGYLRIRVSTILGEVQAYRAENARTSIGERLEFWKKSVDFITAAPVIGHGTGTIRELFRRAATGESGASALVAANPHNQTLAVAIQLGLVGTIVLYAMWIAHLLLFRGEGCAAWIGLAVVVQNMVGSLFNSHLFDFTQGWGYVVGVGIAGGIILRNASLASRSSEQPMGEPRG
jgi:O-antigen ligase